MYVQCTDETAQLRFILLCQSVSNIVMMIISYCCLIVT